MRFPNFRTWLGTRSEPAPKPALNPVPIISGCRSMYLDKKMTHRHLGHYKQYPGVGEFILTVGYDPHVAGHYKRVCRCGFICLHNKKRPIGHNDIKSGSLVYSGPDKLIWYARYGIFYHVSDQIGEFSNPLPNPLEPALNPLLNPLQTCLRSYPVAGQCIWTGKWPTGPWDIKIRS
jgi:hypothetical protein